MKTLPEIIEKIETSKADIEFLPTGFHTIDDHLDGGFMRKELIILGAYSGLGKSLVAGTIFKNITSKGFKSAYFSLEISNEMIVARLIGALANIKPTRIIAGLLTPEEHEEKLKAKADLMVFEKYMFFYDDLYLLEDIKKQVKEQGYEFVVVDFIQNIVAKGLDEYERLSFISLELQKLAKETNSCILVLSQLSNRAAREGKDAPIIEYKGSGNIATVCDLGFFMERGEIINDSNTLKITLKKNRRGPSGITWDLTYFHPGGAIF